MVEPVAISVVIPTYNRASDLEKCLTAIEKQTTPHLETIIIDNGSIDNTREIIRRHNVRSVSVSQHNLSILLNKGLAEARGNIVAFLSDDTEPDSNWLASIISGFRIDNRAAVVGGPAIALRLQEIMALRQLSHNSFLLNLLVRIYDSVVLENKFQAIGLIFRSGGFSMGGSLRKSALLTNPLFVDALTITNMAVRKDIATDIGGFNESFIQHHTDADLCLRLKKDGWLIVFEPRAVVWHFPGLIGPSRSPYMMARDYAFFYLKDFTGKKSSLIRVAVNIFYFNAYWLLRFFQTKNMRSLDGIRGFLNGTVFYIRTRRTT